MSEKTTGPSSSKVDPDTHRMLERTVKNNPHFDAMRCLRIAASQTVGKYDAEIVLNAIREIRDDVFDDGINRRDVDPALEAKEQSHNNPIDESDVTDDERADMLTEFLTIFEQKYGHIPQLMPLEEDSKQPYITGRARLDSQRARDLLFDGQEAVEFMREYGNAGFFIYAGRSDHGTEDHVIVDIDDPVSFPDEHFQSTLKVISGSGRGWHFHYRNAGDVKNANGKAGVDGEIKAQNIGVVVPGSIHETGGVYHIVEEREIATLSEETLPDELRPSTTSTDKKVTIESEPLKKSGDTRFENDLGMDLDEIRENSETVDLTLDYLKDPLWDNDTSKGDYRLCYHLLFWRFTEQQCADILRSYRNRWKVQNRADYVERTIASAVADQTKQYEPTRFGKVNPKVCKPPTNNPETVVIDERRREIDARYDAYLNNRGISAWADLQGMGKTTTAMWAAAERDRKHAVLFPTHQKAHETLHDEDKPGGYLHLKGPSQSRYDQCMDAECTDNPCPDHEPTSNCPRMCPVYELAPDDTRRIAYETLAKVVGHQRAHKQSALFDDDSWHNSECQYFIQYDELQHCDRVIGVHEHQCSKKLEKYDIIVDEASRLMKTKQNLSIARLRLCAKTLEELEFSYEYHYNPSLSTPIGRENFSAHPIAKYIRNLIDLLAQETEPDLKTLEPPDFYPNLPHTTRCEWLARVKRKYNQTVIQWMKQTIADNTNRWGGEPLCLDAVFAAMAESGFDTHACRHAIAISSSGCPACESPIIRSNEYDISYCVNDNCEWNDLHDTYVNPDSYFPDSHDVDIDQMLNRRFSNEVDPARAIAWIDTPEGGNNTLCFHQLREDLPDSVLLLDATADEERIAAVYGVSPDDVTVYGDEPIAVENMNVTQVTDGQYHSSTIENTPSLQKTFQTIINKKSTEYEQPLFILMKKLKSLFEWPENAEVLTYYGLRGLDREDCDAVILLGAPHPPPDDNRRNARLLAQGRDDIDVGGEEFSTRIGNPVSRKYIFTDENDMGREIPAKTYTGLTGNLFHQDRECEMEHAIHRPRPLLANEPIDVLIVSNVPTEIPVDELARLDDLVKPLKSILPVEDHAFDLLKSGVNAALGKLEIDDLDIEITGGSIRATNGGFHQLAERAEIQRSNGKEVVSDRTVRNWVSSLEKIGLLDRGDYLQREGYQFTGVIPAWKAVQGELAETIPLNPAKKRQFQDAIEAGDITIALMLSSDYPSEIQPRIFGAA